MAQSPHQSAMLATLAEIPGPAGRLGGAGDSHLLVLRAESATRCLLGALGCCGAGAGHQR